MGKILKIAVCLCAMLVLCSAFYKRESYCNGRTYNSRSHLCCRGQVRRKFGLFPSCCGSSVYDVKFQLCCAGNVGQKSGSRPRCCGRRVYDANFYKCFFGRVVKN